MTKVLAIVLALTLVFSSFGAVTASAVSVSAPMTLDAGGGNILTSFLDTLLRIVFDWFANLFPNGPGFVQKEDNNTLYPTAGHWGRCFARLKTVSLHSPTASPSLV